MTDSRSYLHNTLGPDPLIRNIHYTNENDLDPLGNFCCICYHTYSFVVEHPAAEDPVKLACGHTFGDICLSKWISTKSTCPLCRSHVQLASQNNIHPALDESFSYHEDFSSYHNVDYETDSDGESEADDEFFDAQEEPVTHREVYRPQDEDMWLTAAVYEENASRYTPAKRGLAYLVKPTVVLESDCYDELLDCHEQWMADSLYDDESEDEDTVTYYDVFPY